MQTLTPQLLSKITNDYPYLTFTKADTFWWSPDDTTIHYAEHDSAPKFLHELSHALLKHQQYTYDIELLQLERAAWTHAQRLAATYNVLISSDEVEAALDTYRDWLHQRSICPLCTSNGIQTKTGPYKCLACGGQWRANDARICELRRFKV